MTRTLAFIAALLLASSPAVAQSPAPSLPSGPALAPAITYTPPPSPTPEPYTPLSCAVLVKRANASKDLISAHAVAKLTEAALREHDFDSLYAAQIRARQAAVKEKGSPLAATASAKAVLAINTAALAVYKAQADVRGCFGLR
jgi:hypothetical protein